VTDKEADLYRWLETRTLFGETFDIAPDDDRGQFAKLRGWVVRNRGGRYAITPVGWEWFAVRSLQIIARCIAGKHDMREKTPYCVGKHCQWCGVPDAADCKACLEFFLNGTVEGGWENPVTPTSDAPIRSPIHHGYERP